VLVNAPACIAAETFALIAMLFAILAFTHYTSHNPIPKNEWPENYLSCLLPEKKIDRHMPALYT
jgi:hypothetical protein